MKKSLSAVSIGALAIGIASASPQPAQAQSDPLIGQLMLFGGNFCPRGWGDASGQLLAISQNTALFSIFGTMYGGDGRVTFALPNLQGRVPIHAGQGPGLPFYSQGQTGGQHQVTLNVTQMPSHNHTGNMRASTALADTRNPNDNVLAVDSGADKIYHSADTTVNMAADTLAINNTGGNQPFNSMPPYQVLRWCVALQGIFPSRN